ncbi:hypothetical protein HDE_06523 [Halotydeus destructor]|nr:hypothetical protein HDE_06523 [Halotydeus destructor]
MLDKVTIERVRELVVLESAKYNFDQSELQMVKNDDVYVNLFARQKQVDIQAVVSKIVSSLIYRKKYEIYNIDSKHLPAELFGARFRIGHDVNGRLIAYMMHGHHRPAPDLLMANLNFFYYVCRKFLYGQPCDIYADIRGLKFSEIDIRYSLKLASLYGNCLPGLFHTAYIFGLPKIMMTPIKALVNILPARETSIIKFITHEEALDRIANLEAIEPPEGCPNLRTFLEKDNVAESKIVELIQTINTANANYDVLSNEKRT